MSAIPILMVLFGSVIKVMKIPAAIDGFARVGISEPLIVPVGLIELVCVVVCAIPRTAVLGAILMTGLLGGAIITTLRVGDHTYPVPFVCGLLAWVVPPRLTAAGTDSIAIAASLLLSYSRSRGRVRHVGPPLPLMHSSLPGNVRTSNPAPRSRSFVLRFSSIASRRLLPSASTLQASVSRSE